MSAPFQESGFVPLKGVASVPIGSTVDTRKGEIAMTPPPTASQPATARAPQSARIKAGMFAIKQKRAKRRGGRKASISTDVDCSARREPRRPARAGKGIVRTISMVVKGYYRALGGASTPRPRRDVQHHGSLRRDAHRGGEGQASRSR